MKFANIFVLSHFHTWTWITSFVSITLGVPWCLSSHLIQFFNRLKLISNFRRWVSTIVHGMRAERSSPCHQISNFAINEYRSEDTQYEADFSQASDTINVVNFAYFCFLSRRPIESRDYFWYLSPCASNHRYLERHVVQINRVRRRR